MLDILHKTLYNLSDISDNTYFYYLTIFVVSITQIHIFHRSNILSDNPHVERNTPVKENCEIRNS